ncbi:hypothetical protein EDD29_2398 [Actinocorallia herbida]|uniref:Uncharacterized protein n=1 Tax=Actinocorallia herbida TaxID=58109 RepID=A0A3N1CU88_9ACTN|nr:hypothetical protein [Actinocorallia herbida]ROO84869.1 hypothetical protein EDD29_2398 [Actinocorallia herbida]
MRPPVQEECSSVGHCLRQVCAFIEVQGTDGFHACDPDASHWESVEVKAAGKCASYLGVILDPAATQQAVGARYEFKNAAADAALPAPDGPIGRSGAGRRGP